MSKPLTPAGCDLRDFPHTPIFRARLFGSSFHARADDSEWRAGVTLWLKSWDQVPAGSLPDDDIELCRLAELARDLKTWKKVKDGALRGWLVCDDGRLYHPVVAEGVNNAIEKKAAQRAKTAKARIAAMEKRIKESKSPDEIEHLKAEIGKLKQGLSQTSVTDLVTDSKRRKGEGEGEGNSSSEANASGGEPPDPEAAKRELYEAGKSLLAERGMAKSQCGSFITKLAKDYGQEIALDAVRSSVAARPLDAVEYLIATCQTLKGERKRAEPPKTVASDADKQTKSYLADLDRERAERTAPPANLATIVKQNILAKKGLAA